MTKLTVAIIFLLVSSLVGAEDLFCNVSVNTEVVAATEFAVAPKTKMTYVLVEGYTFSIANLGESKYELEIYDSAGATRSYATAYLRATTDQLGWTLWSRDILLETSCKLAR